MLSRVLVSILAERSRLSRNRLQLIKLQYKINNLLHHKTFHKPTNHPLKPNILVGRLLEATGKVFLPANGKK
jgi:hypothetical protein